MSRFTELVLPEQVALEVGGFGIGFGLNDEGETFPIISLHSPGNLTHVCFSFGSVEQLRDFGNGILRTIAEFGDGSEAVNDVIRRLRQKEGGNH